MSQRCKTRLRHLEAMARPRQVADVLRTARACSQDARPAYLVDVLSTVEPSTAITIMNQLTTAELAALDALIGPDIAAVVEALAAPELDALIRGDAAVTRRVQRALKRLHAGH